MDVPDKLGWLESLEFLVFLDSLDGLEDFLKYIVITYSIPHVSPETWGIE